MRKGKRSYRTKILNSTERERERERGREGERDRERERERERERGKLHIDCEMGELNVENKIEIKRQ